MTAATTGRGDGVASPPPADRCINCDQPVDLAEVGVFGPLEPMPIGVVYAGPGDEPVGVHRHQHRMCGLRAVVGGWGHHVDHPYWCGQVGDPDGGIGWFESARRVWGLVQEIGR